MSTSQENLQRDLACVRQQGLRLWCWRRLLPVVVHQAQGYHLCPAASHHDCHHHR